METQYKIVDGKMVVHDPVYEEPYILPEYMTEVFQTKEMKRLNDIKQTGYSYIDLPGLKDHNRYGHSIGVAYLMHQFMQRIVPILENSGIAVDYEEVEIAEIVMAAHDIGHTYNSHQSEKTLKYSHESRTVDILLGNTEIGNFLRNKYPKDKLERVIHIITEIDINQELENTEELSPILQLYAVAVSSGFDLDKIDYTVRDSKYAGLKSRIDPLAIIDSFEPSIDEQENYCLTISEEAQRQYENLAIERFQNYRDMYLNQPDEIMANMEPIILTLARQEPKEVKKKFSQIFLRILEASAEKEHITTLEEELQMTDTPYDEALEFLNQNATNPILRYLCNAEQNRKDYQDFTTPRKLSDLKAELQSIFPGRDLSSSNSIFEVNSTCKMIKPKEEFWVRKANGDLERVTSKKGCLIRPEEFKRKRVYFNPELLRLELEMSKEEFLQYARLLQQFTEGINEREEFQAKYIVKDSSFSMQELIDTLISKGFEFEGQSQEQNEDDYFESKDLELLKSGQELRIRKQTTNHIEKMYITYKTGVKDNQGKFSHRRSTRQLVEDTSDNPISDIERFLGKKMSEMFTTPVERKTFMHASTDRTNLYFIKNGKRVCVSWDNTTYNNKWLKTQATDTMIEVQCIDKNSDRIALKAIEDIMSEKLQYFEPYKHSKVSRGAELTYRQKKKEEKDMQKKSERELKCTFDEKDREKVEEIIDRVLNNRGLRAIEDTMLDEHTDTYYDTPDYHFVKTGSSLRIRSKNDNLVGTYKSKIDKQSNMFSRIETEVSTVENTALALILSMKTAGIKLPQNIRPVIKVKNKRKTRKYEGSGMSIEFALDKLANVNLGKSEEKEAYKGEFELEFDKCDDEKLAEEEIQQIWLTILAECTKLGITIEKSKESKYARGLRELGIISDRLLEER